MYTGQLERRRDVVDGRDAELGEVLLRRARLAQALVERLRRDGGVARARAPLSATRPVARPFTHSRPGDRLRADEPRALERDAVREPRAPIPAIEQDRASCR